MDTSVLSWGGIWFIGHGGVVWEKKRGGVFYFSFFSFVFGVVNGLCMFYFCSICCIFGMFPPRASFEQRLGHTPHIHTNAYTPTGSAQKCILWFLCCAHLFPLYLAWQLCGKGKGWFCLVSFSCAHNDEQERWIPKNKMELYVWKSREAILKV